MRGNPDQVGLKDVARAAGVSMMTASRALRGIEGVSETRRAEIFRIARELGYRPNFNARSLAVANSDLVGISLPTLFNDVFADILEGMRRTFEHAGFAGVIDTTRYDTDAEMKWVERLLSWHPAGIVLTGTDHRREVRELLRAQGTPTLEIWDVSNDPIDICVGIDHRAAGNELGRSIADLGYRRPAFVGAPKGRDTRADARLQGLRNAFSGLPHSGSVLAARPNADNDFAAGRAGLVELIDHGHRPDVVFFLNDHMAFGGLSACQDRGITVPEQIGIVGFNALDLTTVLPNALTTVRTPRRLMGVTGAKNLVARIKGVNPEKVVKLPIEVVIGETVRPRH